MTQAHVLSRTLRDRGRYAKRPAYYRANSKRDRDRMREDPVRYQSHQRKVYEQYLRREYGLSLEELAWLVYAQGFQCATCACKLAFDKYTHVDHCHVSGKVRGILCHDCNITLGKVKENSHTLRKLANYLDSHQKD